MPVTPITPAQTDELAKLAEIPAEGSEERKYPYCAPGDWPNWRCPDCGGLYYANVDEQKPDRKFAPGPLIRCINCKSTFDTRPVSEARKQGQRDVLGARPALGVEGLTTHNPAPQAAAPAVPGPGYRVMRAGEISPAASDRLGAAALAFLKLVPDDWQRLPGDPSMKTRLHNLRLIERGWAPGIYGMYRRTEAGRLALATGGARHG